MKLELVHYPHPTLRHVSKDLKRVDSELRDMVTQMFELMYEHEGVGLAANQVDLPYRVFVTNPSGDHDNREAEQVFINPVLRAGKDQAEAEEGCLSIPGVLGPVVRQEKITVTVHKNTTANYTIVRSRSGNRLISSHDESGATNILKKVRWHLRTSIRTQGEKGS
ncbi:MAG: peptide deformylase [Planctomycetes bacterium]|nr:peptide deformylase [Planctomycetota bacterium]